jgi:hypothetical protein
MCTSDLSGCPLVTRGQQVSPAARTRPGLVLITPRRRRRSPSPTVKTWAARQCRVAAQCVMPHALSNRASRARCVLLALCICPTSACAAGGYAQRPHCVSRRVCLAIARVGHVAPKSTSPCRSCDATAPACGHPAVGCALGGPRVCRPGATQSPQA